ncbi:hypothetical protein BDZ97DRAFT_2082542 [Flammula alnicola]|nr:hypothetical protein BDZ97DRAFT_2082542 [Flammula alnicola]
MVIKAATKFVTPISNALDEDSDMMDLDEDDDVATSSDEESEYGSKKRTTKAPPAKRARTSATSSPQKPATQAKTSSHKKKSLSLLPTMPLDVLFEIFGMLSPKDILSVSRTNKLFRETLMSRGATTVWKAARERLGAPDCPSDLNEVRWAILLFGNTCQNCGAKGIPKADFYLRRRVCTSCKKKNLVVRSKFKTRFPDLDISMLDLIPSTDVGGWAHGHSSNSQFFWEADILDMVHKLATHTHNIHMRLADAKKNLDIFKEERLKLVKEITDNAPRLRYWAANVAEQRQQGTADLCTRRQNAICEKFIELGYTKEDMKSVAYAPEYNQTTALSDRIWQRIRPILEPKVKEEKEDRLKRELRTLKVIRRRMVDSLYNTYKKSLRPSQWRYLPRTLDVCELEPFARLIDSSSDVPITEADFGQCMERLPELLTAEQDLLKIQLRGAISPVTSSLANPSNDTLEAGEITEASTSSPTAQPVDCLELATSVFECRVRYCNLDSRYLVGYDIIATHHCKPEREGVEASYYYSISPSASTLLARPDEKFTIDTTAVATARALVLCTGLDPNTTLATDMDAKDYRFTCLQCRPQKANGVWTRIGYSWRTAISHTALHATATSFTPWEKLSTADADMVKDKERNDAKWQTSNWTCGHCSAYLTTQKSRADILQHVQAMHGIALPREPDDIFFFERIISPLFRPSLITYSVPEPPMIVKQGGSQNQGNSGSSKVAKCLRCALGSAKERTRLFDVSGVRSHLKAKHGIPDPIKGVDWI